MWKILLSNIFWGKTSVVDVSSLNEPPLKGKTSVVDVSSLNEPRKRSNSLPIPKSTPMYLQSSQSDDSAPIDTSSFPVLDSFDTIQKLPYSKKGRKRGPFQMYIVQKPFIYSGIPFESNNSFYFFKEKLHVIFKGVEYLLE